MRNRLRLVLLTPVAATALSGCFLSGERHAGVDDFPNSLYGRVSGFLGESQSGTVAVSPEAMALANLNSGVKALAKGGAAPAVPAFPAFRSFASFSSLRGVPGPVPSCSSSFSADTSTVSQGFALWKGVEICPEKTTYVLAWVRWDERARDTVKDNENILRFTSDVVWKNGRLEHMSSEDADGDSLVNPVDSNSRARIVLQVTDSGKVSRAELVAGAGPDLDFENESDNRTDAARWWAWRSGAPSDTLYRAQYLDAGEDGDSSVIDNRKASVVILDFRAFNPAGKPDVAEERMRLKVRARFEQKSEVLGLSGEERLRDGRQHRIGLFNLQGGTDLDLEDTVLARFTSRGAPSDTLDSLEAEFRMTLGDFDAKDDDRVHGFSLSVANKLGAERRGHFQFASDTPMPPDTPPRDGRLTLRLDYEDNTVLLLDGKLEAGALTATVTLRDGRQYDARWDAAGKLLEWKAR